MTGSLNILISYNDAKEQGMENQKIEKLVPESGKKAYNKPSLTEYGSIAKLTQGGGVSGTDVNTMMGACL